MILILKDCETSISIQNKKILYGKMCLICKLERLKIDFGYLKTLSTEFNIQIGQFFYMLL